MSLTDVGHAAIALVCVIVLLVPFIAGCCGRAYRDRHKAQSLYDMAVQAGKRTEELKGRNKGGRYADKTLG